MRVKRVVLMVCFILVISVCIFLSFNMNRVDYESLFSERVSLISQYRVFSISSYVESEGEVLDLLAESEGVKSFLREPLVMDLESSEVYARLLFKFVYRDLENYLAMLEVYTVGSLGENGRISDIINNQISPDDSVILFSIDDSEIIFKSNDFSISNLGEEISVDKILGELVGGEGLYVGSDMREYYVVFRELSEDTDAGEGLGLLVMLPVSSYNFINGSEEFRNYLAGFQRAYHFNNIFVISKDATVVYSAKDEGGRALNLEWETQREDGLSLDYFMVKDSSGKEYYGPYVRNLGDDTIRFSVMQPIYDGDLILGYVAVLKDMNDIWIEASDITGLKNTGESYVVNADHFLITGLRSKYLTPLVQTIDEASVVKCFDAGDSLGSSQEILNYEGVLSISSAIYIPITQWCSVTEISKGEVWGYIVRQDVVSFLFFVLELLLLVFFVIIVNKFLKNMKGGDK